MSTFSRNWSSVVDWVTGLSVVGRVSVAVN